MSNRLLNKAYVERQFNIFHSTYVGVVIKSLTDTVNNKVDPKEGYDLSTNDFTDELKEKLDGLKSFDDTEYWTQVKKNAEAICVLNSDITVKGSILYTIEEAVSKIIKDAPEQFDTINEISTWIVNHNNAAVNMQNAVDQNTSDLEDLKKRWDEYGVLVPETENLDFLNDENFSLYEWVHIVPDSLAFTGSGRYTENHSDYTVKAVSSKQLANGQVYSSDPETLSLSDIETLNFNVVLHTDENIQNVKVSVSGICCGSSEYSVGKVDTVDFTLHSWSHVNKDTLKFEATEESNDSFTLTSDLDDYLIEMMISEEIDSAKLTTTDPEETALTDVAATGIDADVDFTTTKNSRSSKVTLSGKGLTSSSYSETEEELEYQLYDWFMVDDSTLACTKSNITDSLDDYTVDLVHYMQKPDGSVVKSDPLTVTLAEAKILGLDVIIKFYNDTNARKANITISGIDIKSTTAYTGAGDTVSHSFYDWYSIDSTTIAHTASGDLTANTSDYSVTLNTNTGEDSTVSSTSSTVTLADLTNYGIVASVDITTSLNDGAVTRDADITITGTNLNSNTAYSSSSATVKKKFTDHEWYDTDYPTELKFTGTGDLTSDKSDYTISIAYCKEDNSGTVYSNTTVTKTLAEADAAGLVTTLAVTSSSGAKTAKVTVTGAGISDNSTSYSGTISTKEFNLHSWKYVSDSAKFVGSGSLTDTPSDYTVDVSSYKETTSNSTTGTTYGSVETKKLSELEAIGLTYTLAKSVTNGCIEVGITVTGTNINSNTSYNNSSNTRSYKLHEWLYVGSNAVFDTSNVTADNNYDACTVSDIGRAVETISTGTASSIETEQTYTVGNIKAAGVSASVATTTEVTNGQYMITNTLTLSGKNLLQTSKCTGATENKVLTAKRYATYASTSTDIGDAAQNSVLKWAGE